MRRFLRIFVTLCVLLGVKASSAAQVPRPEDLLRQSSEITSLRGAPAAVQFLQEELQKAIRSGDSRREGWAKVALGRKAVLAGRYDLGRSYLDSARTLAAASSDRLLGGIALAISGHLSSTRGDAGGAMRQYRASFERFSLVGDSDVMFDFVREMTTAETHLAEKNYLIANALELARKAGRVDFQAGALKVWSAVLADQGNFQAALDKLQEAAKLAASVNSREAHAGVLAALGKLYGLHGKYSQAIEYFERARDIYRQSGSAADESMMLQALSGAYFRTGERRRALEAIERSVTLAQQSATRSGILVSRLAGLGRALVELGEYRRAIDLLEDLVHAPGGAPLPAYSFLSAAYRRTGRLKEALEAADRGLALVREAGNPDGQITLLFDRGQTLNELGRPEEAMSTMRESLALIESTRAGLIRADSLKAGYTSRYLGLVNFSVKLFCEAGRAEEGFQIAEQARARSFLDLLGTRNAGTANADVFDPGIEYLDGSEAARDEPLLASTVSIPAATFNHAVEIARRLNSRVLSYWVNPDALYIWIVGGDGSIASVRQNVTQQRLQQLVSAVESRRATNEGSWRELYRLLIAPVKANLPKSGSRLTIVPHAELFKLPFAALKDMRGRYLVEDYIIGYVPALATFDLVDRRNPRVSPARYLLAADPHHPARLADGGTLEPLAGSRVELQKISAQLPGGLADEIAGSRLRLDAVLRSLHDHSVIHFATHAVIDSERPMESFLALSEGEKLTARAIYDVPMNADLVMLSACRSASGPISVEGVLGLSRAFLYAGTASVVASIWDVPDEPSAILVEEFYREYQRTREKDRALRAGQIRLIQDLRAGRIRAATPAGPMGLPEYPSLWAGFVLIGRPAPN